MSDPDIPSYAQWATFISSTALRIGAFVFLRWVGKQCLQLCAGQDGRPETLTLVLTDTWTC